MTHPTLVVIVVGAHCFNTTGSVTMGRVRETVASVACLSVPYFSALFYKRYDCREKLLNMLFVFVYYFQRDTIINALRGIHVKVPVIFVRF